jgi:hypothetical protein
MNNTFLRIGIVSALGYYFYEKYKMKPSPMSDYTDVPLINPDAPPPILDPKPRQIEDILNQQQQPITTPSYVPNSSYEDFFNPVNTTTTTVVPDPKPDPVIFNPDNPYDPSGSSVCYAGGWSNSYASYC